MAWEYHVYLIDPSIDYVPIEHVFYGHTKEECTARFECHQDVCGSFGPAIEEGRYEDEWVHTDELPEVEEDDDEDGK